jgi:hypothetical protein
MLKRIVVLVVLVTISGLLIFGAVNRTEAVTGKEQLESRVVQSDEPSLDGETGTGGGHGNGTGGGNGAGLQSGH